MADTQGLGPCAPKERGGSTPLVRTTCQKVKIRYNTTL